MDGTGRIKDPTPVVLPCTERSTRGLSRPYLSFFIPSRFESDVVIVLRYGHLVHALE